MPSATPVPRGPSVIALGSAAELLTRSGCPVCRYALEARDRYLSWFALEAHADPVTITRLCASLGMCARHTRQLMGQPGAAARLTAGYRYVLQAARKQLAEKRSRVATCPGCEHDEAAAGRALDVLLDGLSESGIQGRYLDVGGLCGPHVRAAASMRGHRRAVTWLVQAAPAPATDPRVTLDVLAGGPDYDADERARLRAALPPGGHLPPGTCPVCLTAARAELAGLVRVTDAGGGHSADAADDMPSQRRCLCAEHLRDAALMPDGDVSAELGTQAECQAASLARLAGPPAWHRGGSLTRWLHRGPAVGDECPICQAREKAANRELQRCGALPGTALSQHCGGQSLCVRHVLALRASDPAAGQVAAGSAAQRAGVLIEELAEAFRKRTWTFRHESRGPEDTAWRRAAAFLDGGVFGGGPPE
jgi:hypothetical protein